jgi:hypothetical protein
MAWSWLSSPAMPHFGPDALALDRWRSLLCNALERDNEKPIGNPQSRRLPTWFGVPDDYVDEILRTLDPDKLTLARNFFPK